MQWHYNIIPLRDNQTGYVFKSLQGMDECSWNSMCSSQACHSFAISAFSASSVSYVFSVSSVIEYV